MTELDPVPTQCELTPGIAAELAAAGFDGAREVRLGGSGAVYRCQQRSLRTAAIKVLTTDLDADNFERFLREQRAMGKLSGHPNIVNIFQVGATESGRPYIVMRYHPRGFLNARIHRAGPPRWEETVHIGVNMAGALETATIGRRRRPS
jgi:serine/threonine-protein kinase PknK